MIKHSTVSINGAEIHVARAGRGRPLLLLHGWPEFWLTWEPVMTRLADRFDLIAPDLRGFGSSDKPTGPFGPNEQTEDLVALVKVLGVAPVGVVSHDIGASIAQFFARKHPELIAGLFFFNFMYPGIGKRFTAPEHLQHVWHTWFNQSNAAVEVLDASPESVRRFVTYFLRIWTHRKEAIDDATIEAFVVNFQRPGNVAGGFAHYRAVAAQRRAEAGESPPPPQPIALPTCVRWTECDPTLPVAWADRLGEFFPDVDFAPFPDAGHFPHHEQPDRAAEEIAAFFVRLDREGQWA
ncbi:MAG: alpha/beta hydrolase [Rhodopila sp.]|nr:alpha/beta hydrolase [Rhodopila sp.]